MDKSGLERKSFDAAIEDVGEQSEKPYGGFTAVLSTPSLDRDGDRLGADEWITPLPERLPLDIDHGMSVADTIGSFRPYFDGDRLMMDATFASTPKAQEVRALVKEGHINTVSIAFLSDKSRKDASQPFREVLNAGVVACPSNRDAVILASKAAKADGSESVADAAVKFLETVRAGVKGVSGGDAALVSAIHDASVHLGAKCVQVVQEDSDEDASGADDGANKSVDVDAVEAAYSLEQFKAALDVITSGTEGAGGPLSPVDAPVEDAAAATIVVVPAPVSDAAVDAAESEVVSAERRAARMAMALFAREVLSD